MTIIELAVLIYVISCGAFTAHWMGKTYGFLYGVLGFILGAALSIIIPRTLFYLVDKWRPVRPLCRKGICKWDDYDVRGWDEDDERITILRCKCDIYYVKLGGRLMEILDDGSIKPFMKHSLLGRWKPDYNDKVPLFNRDNPLWHLEIEKKHEKLFSTGEEEDISDENQNPRT